MASPRKLLPKVLSKTALRAEQDIEDARYNLEGERYHIACFLSQQSAEKALKAFLYAEGEEMVWGHSVAELCKRVTSIDKDIEKIRRKVATLDKYYVPKPF